MIADQITQGQGNCFIAAQAIAIEDRMESAIFRLGNVERTYPSFPVVKRFHVSPLVFGLNAQGMSPRAGRQCKHNQDAT